MKIIYYRENSKLMPGIVTDKGVIKINNYTSTPMGNEYSDAPLTMEDLEEFEELERKILGQSKVLVSEDSLKIGPCVPKPSKIICVGLNYRKHAIESNMEIPNIPILFTKYSNTLTDYGSDVVLGTEGKEFDYEVELGVVIGRKCKNVRKEDALNQVFGYCAANDLSCRDLQFKTSQWLLGKSLDSFLPLGKYLVTANEVENVRNLNLSCSVNGELRQQSNTADMIFSVSEIIEYISKHMTLEAGDLILTGTPEGVIMGHSVKNWLKPTDVVKVEIEKLGYSENKMI